MGLSRLLVFKTYPLVRLHYNGTVVLLCDQHAGREGGFDHVNDQIIGKDVQLLHLVPCYVCTASDAIAAGEHVTSDRAAQHVICLSHHYTENHNTQMDPPQNSNSSLIPQFLLSTMRLMTNHSFR